MRRSVAEMFRSFVRAPDAEERRRLATTPLERTFYAQSDRRTSKWHHYLAVYERYLARYRDTPVRLLEIGVHEGGSLQMWRRYLGERAVIHGVDVDPRCAAIDDTGATVHIGSQDDPAFLRRVVEAMGGVDVVVDDGSHVWEHQVATFMVLYPLLAPDGVYVCEDVHTSYWPSFGRRRARSFVEFAKLKVDELHAWYDLDANARRDETFARTTASIAFHDSMVVFERQVRPRPFVVTVGERARDA